MDATVEIYAPLHYAPGSYDWVTVGNIVVDGIDIDHIKAKAIALIEERGYLPAIKLAKVSIAHPKTEIMITEL